MYLFSSYWKVDYSSKLPKFFIAPVPMILSQFKHVHMVLCSPLHVNMHQAIMVNTKYIFFNLSFINILGPISPLSISMVKPLLYQYLWFNLSFIKILGSTSPLSISLVQPLLYQYLWFNLSFINTLG